MRGGFDGGVGRVVRCFDGVGRVVRGFDGVGWIVCGFDPEEAANFAAITSDFGESLRPFVHSIAMEKGVE